MDVSKIREDFSSHLLQIDELNKKLIGQISDLQSQLEEQRNHNTTTKELLLKTQNKLNKTDAENRQHVKKVAHYKSKLKQTHDKTKEAEKGWISLTKYLKSFHNNCKCQAKDRPVTEPSQVQLDMASPTPSPDRTTPSSSHLTSPTQLILRPADPKVFRNPKSPKLSRKRSSTNLKVSPAVVGAIFRTSPKHRVSKLKRTKPTSPKSVKKLCLSVSPGVNKNPGVAADENLVLYAADSQIPDENNLSVNSDISLVHITSRSPDNVDPGICPDSPRSPILNLGVESPVQIQTCKSGDNGNVGADSVVTSVNRETRQFGLLTECNNNISISEEKLGFSLPENMNPHFNDDAETIIERSENEDNAVNNGVDDDDFKISKPSSSNGKSSNNVKTDFKYKKVVRKKEERAKLAASSCPSCYRYYKACGLDEEEIAKLIGDVSRHRHQHGQISNTPPGLWDLTIDHAPIPTEPASQRKPRKNRYITRRDC
ncbi:hypothetical protein ACHWQZ_G017183 [Mnemiopsis leidyi]